MLKIAHQGHADFLRLSRLGYCKLEGDAWCTSTVMKAICACQLHLRHAWLARGTVLAEQLAGFQNVFEGGKVVNVPCDTQPWRALLRQRRCVHQ